MSSDVDLLSGEEVVFSTEKHWIAPLRDSFIPILMLFGAFIVGAISPDAEGGIGGLTANVLGMIRTILLIGGIGWIVYNIVVWRTAKFTITNRRVLSEEGLIGRRSSATMLTSITDVQSRVSFLGGRLGYGDVLIIGPSGNVGDDSLKSISKPMAFRDQVMATGDALATARSGQAQANSAPVPAQPASAPTAASAESEQLATLARLAELRDSGALTPEEYDAKKAEILARI